MILSLRTWTDSPEGYKGRRTWRGSGNFVKQRKAYEFDAVKAKIREYAEEKILLKFLIGYVILYIGKREYYCIRNTEKPTSGSSWVFLVWLI